MQTQPIYYLSPDVLSEDFLQRHVYPSELDLYWSDCWELDFYVALARAGFISTSVREGDGLYLLPEMQPAYAVLDWERLHISRQARRLIRCGELKERGMVLRLCSRPDSVLQALQQTWGDSSWLHSPYQHLMRQAAKSSGIGLTVLAVELWSEARQELVAGELGYIIGRTWTSLTGFFRRDRADWSHYGTIQLLALAKILQAEGFAFWNLGHPYMEYKTRLGARILPRADFLDRWITACAQDLPRPASGLRDVSFPCHALFAGM